MADERSVDAGIEISVGELAALHAVDKIPHMYQQITAITLGRFDISDQCVLPAISIRFGLRDHLPSAAIDHTRTVVSDKGDAVVASIGTVIDAGCLLPDHAVAGELIDRLRRVGRLHRIAGEAD